MCLGLKALEYLMSCLMMATCLYLLILKDPGPEPTLLGTQSHQDQSQPSGRSAIIQYRPLEQGNYKLKGNKSWETNCQTKIACRRQSQPVGIPISYDKNHNHLDYYHKKYSIEVYYLFSLKHNL